MSKAKKARFYARHTLAHLDTMPKTKKKQLKSGKPLSILDLRRRISLNREIIKGNDAEFLLREASNGKFYIRTGQIWRMPKMPGQTILLLDLDNCNRANWQNICRRLIQCGVRVLQIVITGSPGGNGLHVAIVIRGKFAAMHRVALQAICESDPAREAANFRRAMLRNKKWEENWNVLFTKN